MRATLLRLSRTEERQNVLKSKHIFTVIFALIGVALIARGVAGGVWPLSVQFVGGIAPARLRRRALAHPLGAPGGEAQA